MGARVPKDERFFPRDFPVTKSFAGRLLRAGQDLDARILDVSRDGLGALLPVSVGKGEALELVFSDKRIAFTVAHCTEDLIHKGHFRCGLKRVGTENLENIFRAGGFVALDS